MPHPPTNILYDYHPVKLWTLENGGEKNVCGSVSGCIDYHSFGMTIPGKSWTASGTGYRWGFQAQESDNELFGDGNASFFRYRISDNRIGRFFAVDPLAPEYPWNSPYAFSENRVFDGIELEGLEWVNVNADGEETSVNTNPNLPANQEEQSFINNLPPVQAVPGAQPGTPAYTASAALLSQLHSIPNTNTRINLKKPEMISPLIANAPRNLINGLPTASIYNALINNVAQIGANAIVTPLQNDQLCMTNPNFFQPGTNAINQNILDQRAINAYSNYLFPGGIIRDFHDGNLLHPDDHEKVQNAITQTFPAGTNYVAFKTNRNASIVHYIVVQNGVTVTQWLIAR